MATCPPPTRQATILLLLGSGLLFCVGCQSAQSHRPDWLTTNNTVRTTSHRATLAADAKVPVQANAATTLSNAKARTQANPATHSPASTIAKTVAYQEGATQSNRRTIQQLPFEVSLDEPDNTSDTTTSQLNNVIADPIATHTQVNNQPLTQSDSAQNLNGLPIDFPSVLRLAGADNWNVRIAHERICEAAANYEAARVLWLPSLNYGVGYNHHEGEIQATEGNVSTVSRGSFFVGGGSKIGNNPLAGGSGGPSRLTVDLSLADAIFQPLATRQLVNAERYRESRVFNDVMLDSSLAYFELVRAQSQHAIALENQRESERVAMLTNAFVEAGKGTSADNNRLQVIVNQRRQDVATAQAQIGIASARLANLLQLDCSKLDPNQGLLAMEAEVLPIDLIEPTTDVHALVDQAIRTRNEIKEAEFRAQSAQTRLAAEQYRPYLPNLSAGMSNGFFGGGTGGNLPKLDSRSDVDLQMTWEVRNMGAGNRAAQNVRRSQLNQSIYAGKQFKDQVAAEVATAYHQVQLQSQSMAILQDSITQAETALRLNIEAIQGLEGLPLESVQSLEALARARREYLDAVISYNQAQLQLWRAIGEPIAQDGV